MTNLYQHVDKVDEVVLGVHIQGFISLEGATSKVNEHRIRNEQPC